MKVAESLIILVASGVVTSGLSLLAARSRPDIRGWRHLKPSAMHWTAVFLGGSLCLFMTYIRMFVGSTRTDADDQMTILTWLIIAFGLMTMATAASIIALRRRAVRWRGRTLAFSEASVIRERGFDEIVRVRHNALGQVVLTFSDGEILRIDPYATSAADLLDRIEGENELE